MRLKGVALKGEGEEAKPDPRITFSIAELWSIDRVEDAHREHGYWLAGYSYHGQVGDVSLRYCFDPQRHPEMPYHRHPPGDKGREPWRYVSVEEALEGIDGSRAAWRRDIDQFSPAHLVERAAQLAIGQDMLIVEAGEDGLKQVAITTEGAKLADQGADLEDAP